MAELGYMFEKLSFSHQARTLVYDRYIGSIPQPADFGVVGDIFCLTDNHRQLPHTYQPQRYRMILIRGIHGWIDQSNQTSHINSTPMTKHPLLLTKLLMDPKLALWKHKGSYTHRESGLPRPPKNSDSSNPLLSKRKRLSTEEYDDMRLVEKELLIASNGGYLIPRYL